MLVPPSPKSHASDSDEPAVVAVKCTVSGGEPDIGIPSKDISGTVGCGEEVAAGARDASVAGAALTPIVSCWTDVLLPAVFDAVSVTTKLPRSVNVCEGLSSVLVPPSPKSQLQDVGVLSDVSVNWTVNGAVPEDADWEKSATGGTVATFTVMRSVCVSTLVPAVFVEVRVTVYVPAFE